MPRQWPRVVRYLNWQGETIDELDSADFPDRRAYLAEINRLRDEYALAGMAGQWKAKPCTGWKD